MNNVDLESTAKALVAGGKGILAADETPNTLTRRLEALKINSTPDSRRTYREMFFTTPGIAQFISGVIMQDETIRQKNPAQTPLAEVLAKQGILPGIKVDTGAKPLAGSPEETVTEGLDGLRDRLKEYRQMGAQFAKWRAVIRIGAGHGSAGRTISRPASWRFQAGPRVSALQRRGNTLTLWKASWPHEAARL
jgi:fructose-bisphosphate aldolase class I